MNSHEPRVRGCAHILLLFDEPALADRAAMALGRGPYRTRISRTAEGASAAVAAWRPHLVVVDVELVGIRFLDQLAAVRSDLGRLPIIALTRRGDLEAKLAAFEHGADDVLSIPFSPDEFLARVLALMRRSYREAATFMPVLRVGELEIDLVNRHVSAGGKSIHLTALELSLLYVLVDNAKRALSRDEILDEIWGSEYVAKSNVVDRHIRNLRVKLQADSRRSRCILTVPGRGYRFVPPG